MSEPSSSDPAPEASTEPEQLDSALVKKLVGLAAWHGLPDSSLQYPNNMDDLSLTSPGTLRTIFMWLLKQLRCHRGALGTLAVVLTPWQREAEKLSAPKGSVSVGPQDEVVEEGEEGSEPEAKEGEGSQTMEQAAAGLTAAGGEILGWSVRAQKAISELQEALADLETRQTSTQSRVDQLSLASACDGDDGGRIGLRSSGGAPLLATALAPLNEPIPNPADGMLSSMGEDHGAIESMAKLLDTQRQSVSVLHTDLQALTIEQRVFADQVELRLNEFEARCDRIETDFGDKAERADIDATRSFCEEAVDRLRSAFGGMAVDIEELKGKALQAAPRDPQAPESAEAQPQPQVAVSNPVLERRLARLEGMLGDIWKPLDSLRLEVAVLGDSVPELKKSVDELWATQGVQKGNTDLVETLSAEISRRTDEVAQTMEARMETLQGLVQRALFPDHKSVPPPDACRHAKSTTSTRNDEEAGAARAGRFVTARVPSGDMGDTSARARRGGARGAAACAVGGGALGDGLPVRPLSAAKRTQSLSERRSYGGGRPRAEEGPMRPMRPTASGPEGCVVEDAVVVDAQVDTERLLPMLTEPGQEEVPPKKHVLPETSEEFAAILAAAAGVAVSRKAAPRRGKTAPPGSPRSMSRPESATQPHALPQRPLRPLSGHAALSMKRRLVGDPLSRAVVNAGDGLLVISGAAPAHPSERGADATPPGVRPPPAP